VKIGTRQLESHLRKGLEKLYAVYGAEALLALEAADRIRDAARKAGCTEREMFFAEPGVDWNRLGASASNMSLFASRRLVELRIPTGKPGTEGGKAIDAWASKLPDDAVTLVLLPDLEWQQQKTKWFESLERHGVLIEAKPISRDELPDWLAERLSRQQQRASVETLEWLADRVEGNLLAAKQEVEKLALLLPKGEITLDAIRDAVTDVSRFEREALLEAIHGDDPARVARVVAGLAA
jgi:DNA polymerase-3 subunit delta